MSLIARAERLCPFCDGGNPWRTEGVFDPPPCRFCAGDGAVVPAGHLRTLRLALIDVMQTPHELGDDGRRRKTERALNQLGRQS